MRVDRELEKLAQKEHPGMLAGLPGDKKQQVLEAIYKNKQQGQVVSQTQQVSTFQSAPVPPPDFLKGYNDHIPDGANRLFSLIEKQSTHRIAMEAQTIGTQNTATIRGQWMALGLVVLMCAVALYAITQGFQTLAGIIFGTTILGVASVFISGKVAMRRSLERKKPH